MKQLILALLMVFSIKCEVSQREINHCNNFALSTSVYELVSVYKLEVSCVKPIIEFIIDKMYQDKDFYGLYFLKGKLNKLINKDNAIEISNLQFQIYNKLEILKSDSLADIL